MASRSSTNCVNAGRSPNERTKKDDCRPNSRAILVNVNPASVWVRKIEIRQALADFWPRPVAIRKTRTPGMTQGRGRFETEGVGLRRHLAIPPDADPRLA